MKKIAMLSCLLTMVGCTTSLQKPSLETRDVRSLMPVTDLVGDQAAAITITRASGNRGAIHPLLAKAIGQANRQQALPKSTIYAPNSIEMTLDALLQTSSHYATLRHLLDPDNDVEPKAQAGFSIDYSDFTEHTVQYMPDKYRRTYTYEIGLSFRLINPEGKLAYERKFVQVDRQICVYDRGHPCLEIKSGRTIAPEQTFLHSLKSAYHKALLETCFGLHDWAEVIRHLTAKVEVYHGSGRKIETEQSAAWLRKKAQADQRYLYINLPHERVILRELIQALKQRGERLNAGQRKQLQNFITTTVRSHIDQQLQARLKQSGAFAHAAIFLMPDPDAIWFQDALSIVLANAINQQQEVMELTAEGMEYHESLAFGKLCSDIRLNQQRDKCLSINVFARDSKTVMPEERANVISVVQSSIFAGVLLDPTEPDKNKRYFPDRQSAKVLGAGTSDNYVKVVDAGAKNDDAIYLREAAQKAGEDLALQLADNIIETYQRIYRN